MSEKDLFFEIERDLYDCLEADSEELIDMRLSDDQLSGSEAGFMRGFNESG